VHPTIPALQSHIELNHMSRIFLPCPIKGIYIIKNSSIHRHSIPLAGCDMKVASSAYLLTHLEDEHAISENSTLVVPDLASWSNRAALCSPIKPEPPQLPPPLPTHPLSCDISPCVASAKRKSMLQRPRSMSQVRPVRRRTLDGRVYEETSEEATIIFGDLPQAATANNQVHDIIIQKKHPDLEYQLAYPQSVIDARETTIPCTVGFEILVVQFPGET
jgi:hypothetical protein